MTQRTGRRRVLYLTASLLFTLVAVVIVVGGGGWWLLSHPQTPVPAHWNPLRDLTITAPVTPVTAMQLRRALADEAQCRAVLSDAAVGFASMDDLVIDPNCGIAGRGLLSRLVTAEIRDVETRCTTALRLSMWEQHVVQPAAREILGTDVIGLEHVGSYNCRRMRSAQGETGGWSSHATADAIDIVGLRLGDGRKLTLLQDWVGTGPEARFLHRIGREACDWFRVVLGPDYNRLHADHFHLQGPGWGFCR